jgi:D-alanyl-D-alanine carboxypeptidase (penicillin-binding protein 5/6)
MVCSFDSQAASKKKVSNSVKNKLPTETSLVVDGRSGKILHARNARKKIYPASLTKIMTIYLVFESLASGKFSLNHKFYVSKNATMAKPSKLYVEAGDKITVKEAILALSIKSANDVAKVVAENIAGNEERFARLMTVRAKQLGMKNTRFVNASGWHDSRQQTTALDLAKLSIAIKRDFPQYYRIFSQTSFKYKGKIINGHNRVTATYPGAEGLKTGYHIPAGFNLITTASRGKKSLVGIVTGRQNVAMRDKKMVELLDKYFGYKAPTIITKKPTESKTKPKRKIIKL